MTYKSIIFPPRSALVTELLSQNEFTLTNIPYKFELILLKIVGTDEIVGGYNPLAWAWNNNNNDDEWIKQKIVWFSH
ncbi:hypothetical protein Glove_139g120 [Diversispora epigaea]|uniref:TLDc domain-containing protein n=1 Tax=Diversispora epigaea TaxID=1348612 RepID=A0A397IVU9_9GLOM|nr:hypothetical protein Glove_139g120 [Diversispora epigaea]